ncbi:uncharacterized protein LOC116017492 [Ipomoea triloba]|uniref:uncharacterized protein LOC116017492 n=1 Tax=Ipomoea triloba TaxID=35885 RepID=UPI00125D96C4|nr:uncharacterized protein LOC116017492 [Ipomoea triloba]
MPRWYRRTQRFKRFEGAAGILAMGHSFINIDGRPKLVSKAEIKHFPPNYSLAAPTPMTLFENVLFFGGAFFENDDASSSFDLFAESLASPGLAPPYAASPSPTRSLFTSNPVTETGTAENAAAATTSVVHHLQRDSDGTECDSLLDMTGGMAISPQFAGFSGDQPLFLTPDMVMNYFPPPSGDSIGNSDPFRLRNFADDSEVQELHDVKRVVKVTLSWNDSQLFSHNDSWFVSWLNIAVQAMKKGLPVAHTDVNLYWKCKYTAFNLIIEFEVGARKAWMELKSVTRPPSGQESVVECLEKDFVEPIIEHIQSAFIRNVERATTELDVIATAKLEISDHCCVAAERDAEPFLVITYFVYLPEELTKSRTVGILPEPHEAECGMDSPCEPHMPKSSATNNSIDGNTHTISRWEKDHGITRQLLQQLFGKSRDVAAKTLKVSTPTFKRACRYFGINRWPNHKGKRPNNCSLNQKQPCPALPLLEGTNTIQCNSTIMSVKVNYNNDTIRFPLTSSSTIKYLEDQLETKFKISLENMSIKYQDEEDEWITLTCDSELLHGFDVLRSCGETVIRMMITPKFN